MLFYVTMHLTNGKSDNSNVDDSSLAPTLKMKKKKNF